MRSSSLFSLSACNSVKTFTTQPLHPMLHSEASEYALYHATKTGGRQASMRGLQCWRRHQLLLSSAQVHHTLSLAGSWVVAVFCTRCTFT